MKLAVKIPLTLALVTVALGVALALYIHVSMSAFTDQAARDEALAQLRVATKALSSTGTVPDFAVLDDPGMPSDLRAAAAAGQRASLLLQAPDVAWAAEPVTGGKVLAVRVSWADSRETLAALDRQLAVGVAVLVGVTGLLAVGVTRGLARRLGAAERSAREIADGDLSVRVSEAVGGRDEVTQLARTVDALAESMQERLASEKRVTADIAHDLRTPVTGLVTAAGLLPDGRPTELVRSQAQRLWRLVEDLLEVARLDHVDQPLDEQVTTVSALAARGVAAAVASGALAGDAVTVSVVRDAECSTDPRRVERILVNLLVNAVRHGGAPVRCVVDGLAIAVSDGGQGFPPAILEHGARRFQTGAADRGSGHGLGLTIAEGQARAVGARLSYANVEASDGSPGGALVTLTLPGAAGEATGRHTLGV